jgi:decaprenylphospho-beta-D-erythro-pentofuranosid-2-ulose 2-reductase
VVVSSVAAERPRADNYQYASTTAGLDSYAQGLRDALAPDIQVMTARPGSRPPK